MRPFLIIGIILLMSVYPSMCKDIAYTFGSDGEKLVGQANITEYNGSDVVSFTVSKSPTGPLTNYKAHRTIDDIKEEIDKKVDKGNDLVRDEGLKLVGNKSGAQRLDQICSIYDYMIANWNFVSDWSGLDLFQYSNYTLRKGSEVGRSGKGDCDDFSILLASLIESIGGTPRIIFAYSPAGGHAYTEVYLGKTNNKDLDRMLKWLRTEYKVNDVNIHKDDKNGDVWLNMDWWKDSGGATHPGGPFYQAAAQIPVYTLETKAALTPIENLPPLVLFNYIPIQPVVGEMVRFNASQSMDPDGKIADYEWDFGDGDTSHGSSKSICPHVYSSSGPFQVNLTITDSQGDRSSKVMEVNVIEPPPEATFTYSLANPKVGDVITFDASKSKGISGQIVEYEWDFGDGYSGKRVSIKHSYYDSGTYNVALTVANDKGAKDTSVVNVTVGQKEEAFETPSSISPENYNGGKNAGIGAENSENQLPVIVSMVPDKSSPQETETIVTWTAEASDPEGDPLVYRFLLGGKIVSDWSPASSWTWATTSGDIGENQIEIQVRDEKHAGSEEFDDRRHVSFTITASGTTQPAIPPQVETIPHSETVTGAGSIRKDYYIQNKANDYAKVSVDIKNAAYYEYRYSIYSDGSQCNAGLNLVVKKAESMTCSGNAKNRKNIPTNIATSIKNGDLEYSNYVVASDQGVKASQNISFDLSDNSNPSDAIDSIDATGMASGDNNIIIENNIAANICERFQGRQKISAGMDTSTFTQIDAITGPLKVSSSIWEGDHKLNTIADVSAGVVSIYQLINPSEARQDSHATMGGATFDTMITNADRATTGVHTIVGSGVLSLFHLVSWKDAFERLVRPVYNVEYEYMPVSYQTGTYDKILNTSILF
jgi:PKD repeat protein